MNERDFRNDCIKKKLLYECHTRQEREEMLMYLYRKHIEQLNKADVPKQVLPRTTMEGEPWD